MRMATHDLAPQGGTVIDGLLAGLARMELR